MTESVRVDFYVLSDSDARAPEHTACRITEKAWHSDHRVFVRTDTPEASQRINDLLWTFRQNSFVPHELWRPDVDERTPVLIGHDSANSTRRDVLVNLSADIPDDYSRFSRIVELIAADDDARHRGRSRWRKYKEHGCEIQSHNV